MNPYTIRRAEAKDAHAVIKRTGSGNKQRWVTTDGQKFVSQVDALNHQIQVSRDTAPEEEGNA